MTTPTVGEGALRDAVTEFLDTLPADAHQATQPDLLRFVDWYGGDRPVSRLNAYDIESYSESVSRASTNAQQRLNPLRNFLTYIHKRGYHPENLSQLARARKQQAEQAARAVTYEEVTEEGYLGLLAELEEKRQERAQVAQELKLAREDGDVRENAPLDSARDRQGHLEARIRDLESRLRHIRVVRPEEMQSGVVRLGSAVRVLQLDRARELDVTLVSKAEANVAQGKISMESPLGAALVSRAVNEEFEVLAPSGTVRYRILQVIN